MKQEKIADEKLYVNFCLLAKEGSEARDIIRTECHKERSRQLNPKPNSKRPAVFNHRKKTTLYAQIKRCIFTLRW